MPDNESIVKLIIADKFGIEESNIKNEMSFSNDLGADSLDNADLIVELEKQFNIFIPDDEADKILTVGDAIAFVKAKITDKATTPK